MLNFSFNKYKHRRSAKSSYLRTAVKGSKAPPNLCKDRIRKVTEGPLPSNEAVLYIAILGIIFVVLTIKCERTSYASIFGTIIMSFSISR